MPLNGNELQFAHSVNRATFIRKHEWNHRKGNGMTVELEEFNARRHCPDVRLATLKAEES